MQRAFAAPACQVLPGRFGRSAERVTERSTYHKTKEEENHILRERLVELAGKMDFSRPAAP